MLGVPVRTLWDHRNQCLSVSHRPNNFKPHDGVHYGEVTRPADSSNAPLGADPDGPPNTKGPGAGSQGQLSGRKHAAPHHVWDSTMKGFRSFTANLREIHVINLAVAELGSIATRQFAQRGKRRGRDMDRLLKRHRAHDLVTRGHDQRRATTLVYAAKPPGIKIPLVQVLFARLGVLADLHRHATPRARITVAGNNNSAILISLFCSPPFCTVRFQNGRVKFFAHAHKLALPAMGSGSDLSVNFPNPVGVVHGAGVLGSVGSTISDVLGSLRLKAGPIVIRWRDCQNHGLSLKRLDGTKGPRPAQKAKCIKTLLLP